MLKCAVHLDEGTTRDASRQMLGSLMQHFKAEEGSQVFYAMNPVMQTSIRVPQQKTSDIEPDMIFISKDCRPLMGASEEGAVRTITKVRDVYPDKPIVWYNPLVRADHESRSLLHTFRKATQNVSLFMTSADKTEAFRLLKNRIRNNPQSAAQSAPYFSAPPLLMSGYQKIGDLEVVANSVRDGYVLCRGKIVDDIKPLGAAMLSVLVSNMDTIVSRDDMMHALYKDRREDALYEDSAERIPHPKIIDVIKCNTNKALAQHGLGQIQNCFGVGSYFDIDAIHVPKDFQNRTYFDPPKFL